MYIGVDYYPEHWPRSRWETDAELMNKAGFNIVRLAEFAWVKLEPEEGVFDFGWLDDALGVLGKQGISAILGTPTAVSPAWLARKYPETQVMQKNGQRKTYGIRKDFCFSSGTYRLLSERITRAMATHFATTKNVIGWQTDNEFGGQQCFCPTCRHEFQDWLCRRYGNLTELNHAWGTHFWGHTYQRWDEIPLGDDEGGQNPSLLLDFKRFTSWLNVRFQHEQVAIVRKECPQHFITHNCMGVYADLDYYDLSRDLDFVSWDNYPVWDAPAIPYNASCAADIMRGLKKKNFWIMEQTAGPGGWGEMGRNPRPGEIRKVSYQQMAHGADAQIWFRWRTCTAGREQYWHGLLGHDGKALRRYNEAAHVAREFHLLAKEIEGTSIKAEVAIIWDYDSMWAFMFQPAYKGTAYAGGIFQNAVYRWYNALFRAGIGVDMIKPTDDFSGYKMVIAPHLYCMPDDVAQRMSAFVKKGGVFITDCRTGVKDTSGLCYDRTLPGLLSDVLGITIEEYEALSVNTMEYGITGTTPFLSGEFTGIYFADWVTSVTAQIMASFKPAHMKKFAAVTHNTFGKGCAYYVGTIAKEEALYDGVIRHACSAAGIIAVITPPAGVEVTIRQGNGKKLLFVINHTEEHKCVELPAHAGKTHIGTVSGKTIELNAFDVAVVALS